MSESSLLDYEVEVDNQGIAAGDLLPRAWRAWVAENRLAGITDHELTEILLKANFQPGAIAAAMASDGSDPSYQVAEKISQQLRKLQSVATIRRSLLDLAFPSTVIERRTRLSSSEFLERYYAVNRPVVLSGLLSETRACTAWTPEYLAAVCGQARVEIMAERTSDANYEQNSNSHRRSVLMHEYVQMVTCGGESNDYYLVANNGFFELPETQRLFAEVPKLSEFLSWTNAQRKIFFWFGPGGTITPLHHDVMNIFAAQISGRKRFLLFSPEQTKFVYNKIGVYGEVDCRNPDYARHPLYAHTKPLEVILEPGDVLFIPVGWWHYVEGLETAMMISYTNFHFPNEYEWTHPSGS